MTCRAGLYPLPFKDPGILRQRRHLSSIRSEKRCTLMTTSAVDEKMNGDILRVLNEIEDPELGIGIVDIGLIYRAEWTATGIEVDVTTTVPSCPYADWLCDQIDVLLRERFREASAFTVQLVFDPPWVFHRLSESARQTLGWADPTKAPDSFVLECWDPAGARKH